MLEDMTQTETYTSVVAKANGLLLSIEKLELIAMLIIFNKVLQMTSILSKTLQADDVNLTECFHLVDSCIANLKESRQEPEF